MPPQDLLHQLLRHAMRKLGGAPRARELPDRRDRFAGRGELEAGELVTRIAGEIRDIGRKIGRQPERPDLVGEAQAPEMLHGARLRRIGLRIERSGRLLVDQNGGDTAASQLVGEHEPAGASADDQDVTIIRGHERHVCTPRGVPASSSRVTCQAAAAEVSSHI